MKHYEDIAAEDYYEMGYAWAREKNLTRAKECLIHAIEMNPHFIYAYVTLSEVLSAMGNFAEAAHILKKASKMDPKFHRLQYLQARYYYKDGNFPAALRAIEHAISSSPQKLYLKSKKIILHAMDCEKRKQEKC